MYIPTVDIIQSPFFDKIFPFIEVYINENIIKFVGSELSTQDILESKHKHFQNTGIHPIWFEPSSYTKINSLSSSFVRKNFSTTKDMLFKWQNTLVKIDNNNFITSHNLNEKLIINSYKTLNNKLSQNKFISKLGRLEEKLGEHAFLWSVIKDTNIFNFKLDKKGNYDFEFILASLWIQSYIDEYNCNIVSVLPILGQVDCNIAYTSKDNLIDLNIFEKKLKMLNIFDLINNMSNYEIIQLKNEFNFQKFSNIYIINDIRAFNFQEMTYLKESIQKIKKESISNNGKINKIVDLYLIAENNILQPKSIIRETVMPKETSLPLICVIIALKEEFKIFHKILLKTSISNEIKNTFYIYSFNKYKIVATFMGDMGGENASIQTAKFISEYNCTLIVNIGIAGGLSSDVLIGDIVIGDQVESYMKVSKAIKDEESKKFNFQLSGEAYRPTRILIEDIEHFEFQYDQAYSLWQNDCLTYCQSLIDEKSLKKILDDKLIRNTPKIEKGHIASGDIVSNSKDFIKLLKQKDRKYLAIEMEAGGILNTIEKLSSTTRSLVIRAISDLADEQKKDLDMIDNGALRNYAMYNAVTFLLTYLENTKV